MKTVLKIVLAIILVVVVLIVGCTVVLGVGVNEVLDEIQKDSDKTAITQEEYGSVKVGRNGNSRKRIEARFGEPQTQEDAESSDAEGVPKAKSGLDCIYYNKKGELISLYQFCFDKETDRVESKSGL